jgi:murein DD-endopeptidase MepM/ murein hydrolase activator NlpD
LPVEGTLLVHAGHDLLSHHRRFPLHSQLADALRIEHNVTRYAYDFAVVDERGELTGGGAPVVAPASGRVVEAQRDQPDNEIGKPPRLEAKMLVENPRRLFGNYVLIEHADGELSLLAHLRMGSVTVRVGDQVQAGQRLGAVGMSGDASLPHLHFQVQAGAGFAEGLPARFDGVSRKIGEGWVDMPAGSIESGEIVRSMKVTPAGL